MSFIALITIMALQYIGSMMPPNWQNPIGAFENLNGFSFTFFGPQDQLQKKGKNSQIAHLAYPWRSPQLSHKRFRKVISTSAELTAITL